MENEIPSLVSKVHFDKENKSSDHENRFVNVDTDGNSREEKHFINPGEIFIAKELIDGFLSVGIDDIIISTPYKQQERMLQFQLNNNSRNNRKIRERR